MTVRAFWSYRRDDDESENGRISEFARQVANQFELLTGTSMTLFLDRDSLAWGTDWQEGIAKAVNDAVFFIPVYTPRYFQSPMCRQEFRSFVTKARDLGATERILGLTYIDVPDLSTQSNDEIMAWAAMYQHLRLDLRWIDPDSLTFRQEASTIAQKLVRLEAELNASIGIPDAAGASREAEANETSALGQITSKMRTSESIDDGYADLANATSAALPKLDKALRACNEAVDHILTRTRELEDTLKSAPGANARVALLTAYLTDLRPSADKLDKHSASFSAGVDSLDTAVQAIYHWPHTSLTSDAISQRRALALRISKLQKLADASKRPIEELQPIIRRIARQSRIAGASLARIRGASLQLIDGRAVINEWKFVPPYH